MNDITLKALAKINIGLDVTGIREDGYHEVRMIMQTVNLFDKVTVSKRQDNQVTMKCNLNYLTCGEDNLCVKAARMLIEEFHIETGVDIYLEKHIPIAAGMAGGSTDGAAVLWAVNQIYELGLTRKQLMSRGVKLGADVPYCLMRGTALSEGIGEVLSPLPPMIKCPVLIAKPGISVSTRDVYQALDAKFDTVCHPDIDKLIEDIKEGDLDSLCSHMGNVLEEVTIPKHPVIADIKRLCMESGASGAMMSGSGPTVFAFFKDEDTAYKAKERLTESGLCKQLYVTSIFNNK